MDDDASDTRTHRQRERKKERLPIGWKGRDNKSRPVVVVVVPDLSMTSEPTAFSLLLPIPQDVLRML